MAFVSGLRLRRIAQEAKEHSTGIPLLSARFRPVSGSVCFRRAEGDEDQRLGEDFCWQANGLCVGFASAAGEKWIVISFLAAEKNGTCALNPRRNPL